MLESIKCSTSGAYYLRGQWVPADAQAPAALAAAGVTAEQAGQAYKGTMAYGILTAHNTSGNDRDLRIKFDAMASHDITFVGIIQTARASGLEKFPIPYVLTNCHNSLCAVGGTINEDDHRFGLSAAKKYGGIFVPPHMAVIHQYMRERFAGCGKMILGSDSHTRYGALGPMASGEGGGEPGGEEYRRAIGEAVDILEGRSAELVRHIETEMNAAAEDLRFEEAGRLRDRMRAVSTLENRQRVIAAARADTDAVGFVRGAKSCFSVLHYTNGDLSGKDVSLIDDPTETDGEALSALLRQYYVNRSNWPKTILLPFEPEDKEDIERWLSDMAGRRVYLEVPQRGDRARFAEKAAVNAREEILRSTTAEQRRSKTLSWLQEALQLTEFPHRIEAYDISNTGSTGIVASMTVHVDGKPLKRDYRKFRIRSTETPDDYGSMREVITRRFTHYLDEDGKFSARPDVLFIDGGAEHASAACTALEALGLSLPVFGMVKDDRHRTRALITPEGHEIGIQANPAAFALVGRIQEETHRFAIEYHRSLRDSVRGSTLDKIPGVGEKRRNDLLKTFGSVRAIRAASAEELARAVPKNTAQAVYDYFHKTEEETPCE